MTYTRFGTTRVTGSRMWTSGLLIAIAAGLGPMAHAQISKVCDDVMFVAPFAPGSDQLTPAANAGLVRDLDRLRGCRVEQLVIAGFGDPLQPMPEMGALGERRSLAVALALGRIGIPPALITTRIGAPSLAREGALGGSVRVVVRLSGRLP